MSGSLAVAKNSTKHKPTVSKIMPKRTPRILRQPIQYTSDSDNSPIPVVSHDRCQREYKNTSKIVKPLKLSDFIKYPTKQKSKGKETGNWLH